MTSVPVGKVLPRPRFLLLDLLRLSAALAVLLYHYTARYNGQWGDRSSADTFAGLSQFSAYGFLGVQLFFVISGFVIFLSAEGRTVGQFVSARVARLYPAYWVGVILTSILVTFIAPQLEQGVTLAQVLVNLTMAQEAFGVPHVDGVYWTLWVELLFYIMVALLISVRLTEAKVYWFAFLWPVVAGIAQQAEQGFLVAVLSPNYAPLFAGGMMIYLLHSRGHSLLRWLLLLMNVGLAVQQTVAHEVLVAAPRQTGLELSPTVGGLLVIMIFTLVAVVTLTPLKNWGWSWMTYAGALTYPLYLMHEYWGWWMLGLVHPVAGKWAALAAATAVSFALAIAIERWVERPLRPLIRNSLKKSFDALPRRDRSGQANNA